MAVETFLQREKRSKSFQIGAQVHIKTRPSGPSAAAGQSPAVPALDAKSIDPAYIALGRRSRPNKLQRPPRSSQRPIPECLSAQPLIQIRNRRGTSPQPKKCLHKKSHRSLGKSLRSIRKVPGSPGFRAKILVANAKIIAFLLTHMLTSNQGGKERYGHEPDD